MGLKLELGFLFISFDTTVQISAWTSLRPESLKAMNATISTNLLCIIRPNSVRSLSREGSFIDVRTLFRLASVGGDNAPLPC